MGGSFRRVQAGGLTGIARGWSGASVRCGSVAGTGICRASGQCYHTARENGPFVMIEPPFLPSWHLRITRPRHVVNTDDDWMFQREVTAT
jgi:hypothetical protein